MIYVLLMIFSTSSHHGELALYSRNLQALVLANLRGLLWQKRIAVIAPFFVLKDVSRND